MLEECPHEDDVNCCPVCVSERFPPTNADRNPSPDGDHKVAERAAPEPRRIGPDVDVPEAEPNA